MDRINYDRSAVMQRIKSKNTGPELLVRRLIHKMGYRYRLHGVKLPGKPDLVFSGKRKVIFINGCFWHQHEGCKISSLPKSNIGYWHHKLEKNKARDIENRLKLQQDNWGVMVIWECELKNIEGLIKKIKQFLN